MFIQQCKEYNIPFNLENSIKPHDDTTLFCCSGMQQFKSKFKDPKYFNTISNIQPCLRLNDIDEIGDGTHLLYFNMIGLFSFRQWTVKESIDFWMNFLMNKLNLKIDYVTIHPDRFQEWKDYYSEYSVEVRSNSDCIWTDGEMGGYCTEFFIDDVEIGNIVNCNGDSIDVGFGLERLQMMVGEKVITDKLSILKETILKIIESGYSPSNTKQGYVLRKLLTNLIKNNEKIDHLFYENEVQRQIKILNRYKSLKNKHLDKSKEWWFETHGINIDELNL